MLIKIGVDIGTVSWEGLRSLTFDNLDDDIVVVHTMKFGLPLYISYIISCDMCQLVDILILSNGQFLCNAKPPIKAFFFKVLFFR